MLRRGLLDVFDCPATHRFRKGIPAFTASSCLYSLRRSVKNMTLPTLPLVSFSTSKVLICQACTPKARGYTLKSVTSLFTLAALSTKDVGPSNRAQFSIEDMPLLAFPPYWSFDAF
jgi:hypothetical protein